MPRLSGCTYTIFSENFLLSISWQTLIANWEIMAIINNSQSIGNFKFFLIIETLHFYKYLQITKLTIRLIEKSQEEYLCFESVDHIVDRHVSATWHETHVSLNHWHFIPGHVITFHKVLDGIFWNINKRKEHTRIHKNTLEQMVCVSSPLQLMKLKPNHYIFDTRHWN